MNTYIIHGCVLSLYAGCVCCPQAGRVFISSLVGLPGSGRRFYLRLKTNIKETSSISYHFSLFSIVYD